jgi:amidase
MIDSEMSILRNFESVMVNECVAVATFAVKLTHRGYTGVYANGDGNKGEIDCPFEFYKTWVNDPLEAQRMAERITRRTIGTTCCPVAGIPEPEETEEHEKDIAELTHELNLQ